MILFTRIPFFIIFLFIQLATFSQHQKLSDEPDNYPEELYNMLDYNLSNENEELLEHFADIWLQDSYFDADERKDIVSLSQQMLNNRARPYPQFSNLLKIIMLFKYDKIHEEGFKTWKQGIRLLMEKGERMTTINDVFKTTIHLLRNNTIAQTYATRWKASTDNYKFVIDDQLKIVFDKIDLTCYAKRDSIKIYQTKGEFYPVDIKWKGQNGVVTWERADFASDQIYAALSDYVINMKKYKYIADSVTYYNTEFLEKPIMGRLEDKVMNTNIKRNLLYPEFESYTKEFRIEDLYQNINYIGGFLFKGNKIIGTGNEDKKAKLDILKGDTVVFRARSNYLVIRKDRLIGLNTEVAIYTKSDSIYHPSIKFNYYPNEREIILRKGEKLTSKVPYFNSYHMINMDYDELRWMIDEPFIYLTMRRGAATGIAYFKSLNYFNKDEYMAMQYMDPIHPLVAVKQFGKSIKSRNFFAEDFSEFMGFSISQSKHYLMRLATEGYIYYDTETDHVTIKDKLYTTIAASIDKIDYDVINLISETRAPTENAVLDLRNMDLDINGMPIVQVSNAQNVSIIPTGQKITMKRNRSFQFKGKVNAGKFVFYGENFFFNYDSFYVNLQNIDSLEINVQVGLDDLGRPKYKKMKNVIENITGELYVDRSDNKSGKEDYPEYPIFRSKEYSFVYYDDPAILNGIYDKESFYFKLDSFVIDSLDNFTKDALKFDGTFTSADIFPEMRETLRLQEDRSLGFQRTTPPFGTPVYRGTGQYYNDFSLDMNGLRGKGKLEYLSSTIKSEDFIFYPDSMRTRAYDFNIARKTGTSYPPVKAATTDIHWQPYNNKLFVDNIKESFDLYYGKATLKGQLIVEPQGLSGMGTLDMKTGVMKSNTFSFNSNSFNADTADFNLRSLKSDEFTVKTKNVQAHIDYDRNKGTFNANEDYSLVEFPENKYISYLDHFVWHMNDKKFDLGTKKKSASQKLARFKGDTLAGPRYISTDPKQDSLNFVAPTATYDYAENLLKAEKVKYIDVADAKIYPDEGKVTIKENGTMQKLQNADILASDSTQYHNFYNAEVNIKSRMNYRAAAKFDYIDKKGNKQAITFNDIWVDTAYRTAAKTYTAEEDSFLLSPQFRFQGDIELQAEEENLTFDGGVMITSVCKGHRRGNEWLLFRSPIDPHNIYIPVVDDPQNINRRDIYSGTIFCHDSIHIYSSFLAGRKEYSDSYITNATGYLYYNEADNSYEIARQKKLFSPSLPGNYISLDQDTCIIYSEGRVDLGLDLWQVKLNSVGNVTHQLDSNQINLNILMGIDFFMHDNVIDIMTRHIDSLAQKENLKETSQGYLTRLNEYLYQNGYKELKAKDVFTDTTLAYPKELVNTMVLDDIKLEWSPQTESYYSSGKIGIASIKNHPVNIKVNGFMELKRGRSGDRLDVVLKIDRNNWYYFGYFYGVMSTLSSNDNYNLAIQEYNPNKRKVKKRGFFARLFGGAADKKQEIKNMVRPKSKNKPYIYMISADEKFRRFLIRYQDIKGKSLLSY
jgi:hypothetical protein